MTIPISIIQTAASNERTRSRASEAKKEYAHKLRKKMPLSEKRVWQLLRKRKIMNYRFRRSVPLFGYIADFWCTELGMVVEVDGPLHEAMADSIRDANLAARGIATIRVPADLTYTEEGIREIDQFLRKAALEVFYARREKEGIL